MHLLHLRGAPTLSRLLVKEPFRGSTFMGGGLLLMPRSDRVTFLIQLSAFPESVVSSLTIGLVPCA